MPEIDYKSLHVLVVEDDAFMRELFTRVLGELGVLHIETAIDGAEGMGKLSLARNPFNLIICDLEMPKMNGLQFVKRLRSMAVPSQAETPVIIVTGHSGEGNVTNALKLGVQGFLVKPISKAALEKRIHTALVNPSTDGESDGTAELC
jgi:two-component system, chemotaxis family, chemotaxis protein CheY